MIIFDLEEKRDWNRASLPGFNSIASFLAEIFLILCLTTVLAQPMTSSVTKFAL